MQLFRSRFLHFREKTRSIFVNKHDQNKSTEKKKKKLENEKSVGNSKSKKDKSVEERVEDTETEQITVEKVVEVTESTIADKNANNSSTAVLNTDPMVKSRSSSKRKAVTPKSNEEKRKRGDLYQPAKLLEYNSSDDEFEKEERRVRRENRSKFECERVMPNEQAAASNQLMMLIMEELKSVKQQLQSKSGDTPLNRFTNTPRGVSVIKSPSDTTIYAPAVARADNEEVAGVVQQIQKEQSEVNSRTRNNNFENQLTQFLSSIRIGTQQQQAIAGTSGLDAQGKEPKGVSRHLDFDEQQRDLPEEPTMEEVQRKARNRVLEAEKYKAALENPRGMEFNFTQTNQNKIGGLEFPDAPLLDDDKFLEVTSHVDTATEERAQASKFLEFEKLLAKQNKAMFQNPNDSKGQVINGVFIGPAEEKGVKISNVHIWERAFRIYMALYTKAHPTKAPEMVQYMHTIHHAATKYTWENVYYYDITFRRMMEKNPNRSWAKTFGQMWNMALCDPLPKHHQTNWNGSGNGAGQGQVGKRGNKGICWRFNRGICNYKDCKYPHRCTYCGGNNHGAFECYRKNKKSEGKRATPPEPEKKKEKGKNNQTPDSQE